MRIRQLHRDDARPLLAMWNATARFDPLTLELLREKVWDDPDFDPAKVLVCIDGETVCGFVMGVARRSDQGQTGFIKLAAVAADRRRAGIGRRLVCMVEKTLRENGVETVRICESAPNYLTPGIDRRYQAAPGFFRSLGYHRAGEACNMTVDLEESAFDSAVIESELAGRGIEIRRAEPTDRVAVMQLLHSRWPSWQAEVGSSLGRHPPSLHLALRGGAVVAFSAFDGNNRGTGWFGPMGTDPVVRKQGVGQALLLRCLADIAAQGHRRATIPWVGPVDFYRRCAGAAVSRTFNRYEKVLKA